MSTNFEIYDENRIDEASRWIRAYLMKNPKWVPTFDQLTTVGSRFKISDKKVLDLYERFKEEADVMARVANIMTYMDNQSYIEHKAF